MNKVEKTISTLKGYFKSNWIISCGLSGKDSTVVAHCAVEALRQAYIENPSCNAILYIVTTNTTIDNFEVHKFILDLHKAADEYAKEYELPIHTKELTPKLFNRPMVEYIGRGKLLRTPVTSSRGRDCTVDWKIEPVQRFMKYLKGKYQTEKILNISGTRDEESVARAANIAKRGESIDTITKTELGYALAPIKDWTVNDVWGLIGQIENDEVESFIDGLASGLRKHYGAGNGGTCDIYFGNNKSADKACGARFGCVLCSLVKNDKSLQSQIDTQPETYGYMAPFIELRRFMNDTLFDMERSRSLLGREVFEDEWIKVGYNQYSLEYRKELLRYTLTIDANERERAFALNQKPRFEMIGYEDMIAIQYHWAREGGEMRIAEAISIWHEVHTYNKRFSIPETSPTKFSAKELEYGNLNFISGAERHEYRYVNLSDLEDRFDFDMTGLTATKEEQKVLRCHIAMIKGQREVVTPFTESKANTIAPDLAEYFINEAYFDLEADGFFFSDEYEYNCPSNLIKLFLIEEIVTLRKGSIARLHKDVKRAQVYNAIAHAKGWGSSGIVDSIVLAHSVKEDIFTAKAKANSENLAQAMPQMAMGF